MDLNEACIAAVEHIIHIKERQIRHKMSSSQLKQFEQTIPWRVNMCVTIGDKAISAGINPLLAISIAIHESEFENITSRPCENKIKKRLKRRVKQEDLNSCAQGPLQATPRYLCPDKTSVNCDLIEAGLEGVRRMATFAKVEEVIDPYYFGFCIENEAQCGLVLAKYNRGMDGQYKKDRLEYRRYAKPILNIYKHLFYKLDLGCTC